MTAHVERFRATIARELGLQFDDGKLQMLGEVLTRRARGHRDEAAYLAHLGPSELAGLAEELTVGETYFFRNPEQFAALSEVVLPGRRQARAGQPVRILSAGCSSGEEPYSIAINLAAAFDPSQATVHAIDVNPAALQRAAVARYTSWALRGTPLAVQRAWFREDGPHRVLDQRIRTAVSFERRNLVIEDPTLWQPDRYDVVFCRNVLMYFSPTIAGQVIARIARSLAPGGYLFLGHAETLRGLSPAFQLCHTHGTFYYQRAEAELTAGIAQVVMPDPVDDPIFDSIAESIIEPSTAPEPRAAAQLASVLELVHEERFAAALDALDEIEAPGDRDRLLVRAAILAHGGHLAEAEAACRLVHAIHELDAGAHYVLALCRDGAGDLVAATEHDRIAAYLDPMFAMPHLHLGLLARRTGDRETARRALQQALLLLPHEETARLMLFGGGFTRDALIALCRAELARAGGER